MVQVAMMLAVAASGLGWGVLSKVSYLHSYRIGKLACLVVSLFKIGVYKCQLQTFILGVH